MEKDLDKDQQRFLLKLARDSIKYYLEKGKHIDVEVEEGVLKEKRGAFVTIKHNHQLRGCIGYPTPSYPLYKAIIETSIMAAAKDPRFLPVEKAEFPAIDIEVSVLSVPKRIKDISEIEVGRHGIIVSKGLNSGLLLPQVPMEYGWDLETYLRHGCLKAGLSEEAWKKGAEIEIFTAQVFSEKDFNL